MALDLNSRPSDPQSLRFVGEMERLVAWLRPQGSEWLKQSHQPLSGGALARGDTQVGGVSLETKVALCPLSG